MPPKLKGFVNYFLGPVLFVAISVSIYRQIENQHDLPLKWVAIKKSFSGAGSWKLYLTVLLMLFNWGIESVKWQVLLAHLMKVPFIKAFKSVVAGVAFTMITPNRTGEFIGRVFYVPDGNRIRAAALTLISSASQLIVTLTAGSMGLLFFRYHLATHTMQIPGLSISWMNLLSGGTIFILAIIVVFYLKVQWLAKLVERLPGLKKYAYFIQPLEEVGRRELVQILFLSALRYCIFLLQYWLLFKLFDVEILFTNLIMVVTVLFLVLAVVPTIALAELGIRSKASITLFSLFSSNTLGILVATATVWLINIIFPAIAGSLFVLGIKLFRKE